MAERPKILLLDDEQNVLEIYPELLARLPSKPEVRTADSGARALAMLESEPFSLLLCDLNMPHMDGLQVLAIVRRKFPQLRTAMLTAITDEQFRARAYGMGLDLYLEKPTTGPGIKSFLDCVESLLDQCAKGGFRGMQSKGLVDIIQMECLCRSSSVIKISNGAQEARVWFQDGEIIDAAAPDLAGEAAFQRILAWKTGNFEILPPEPARKRAIFGSYESLLLGAAQVLDEAGGTGAGTGGNEPGAGAATPAKSPFRHPGVEFGLAVGKDRKAPIKAWGVEDPPVLAEWARATLERFRALGEELHVGPITHVQGCGLRHHIMISPRGEDTVCAGFRSTLSADHVRATMTRILTQWDS